MGGGFKSDDNGEVGVESSLKNVTDNSTHQSGDCADSGGLAFGRKSLGKRCERHMTA